jgi:plastocyanin domain-containing protein
MKISSNTAFVWSLVVIGAIAVTSLGRGDAVSTDNVSMVGDTQVITITAKGGYLPRVTAAKAGVPTVLKMDTQGTYDCSVALSIPSIGYRKNLPPQGETLIDIPAQPVGTSMRGVCSMGMYSFTLNFL